MSFGGSLVAFGKLQELLPGRPIGSAERRSSVNLLLSPCTAACAVRGDRRREPWLVGLDGLSRPRSGVMIVLPIGGADMPVVISLLNSFTGLAAAATGFVLGNTALIIAGMLVGASGTFLTQLMAKAMNRSIPANVAGAFGGDGDGRAGADGGADRHVRATTAADAAIQLAYAHQVIVVPGLRHGGRAGAARGPRAGRAAREARRRGQVRHPSGGRPHAGAHERAAGRGRRALRRSCRRWTRSTPSSPRTDVALVIGANDVVNPAARNDPGVPIYGMPILDVDQRRRDRAQALDEPGFAGIENPLFYDPKTVMLFGDAKASVIEIAEELKAL